VSWAVTGSTLYPQAKFRGALDKRASDGRAPRTLNIALTSLRNIYAEAIADGLVETSPCQSVKWRKVDNMDRKLVTARDFDSICDAAMETSKNGHQFFGFDELRFSLTKMEVIFTVRFLCHRLFPLATLFRCARSFGYS